MIIFSFVKKSCFGCTFIDTVQGITTRKQTHQLIYARNLYSFTPYHICCGN